MMFLRSLSKILWISFLISVLAAAPVQAETEGGQIFRNNCAACHAKGKNVVVARKNLRKETLQKYGMYSREAIEYQVTHGKNAMPSFRGRLNDKQIGAVAAYILQQSKRGWQQ